MDGTALHAELDVTDAEAVARLRLCVENELGPLDVVVTAAGVQRTGASEAVDAHDWKRVLDVNLTGTWNVIQAALPGMLERSSGRIVTISSEVGLAGLGLRRLRGVQGRRDRAHQVTRPRARPTRHLRQQRGARADRGRHAA